MFKETEKEYKDIWPVTRFKKVLLIETIRTGEQTNKYRAERVFEKRTSDPNDLKRTL